MKNFYYGMSCSDANETQIKIVWYYNNVLGRPSKKKIISRERGLSRLGHRDGQSDGFAELPSEFRFADRARHAYGLPALGKAPASMSKA